MSWWKKPFTIILVPHDGTETQSFSVNWLILSLFLIFTISLLSSAAVFTYTTLTATVNEHPAKTKYRKTLAKLNDEQKQNKKLRKTLASLQDQLKETKRRHESILRISGFSDYTLPSDRKGGIAKKGHKTHEQAKRQLEQQIQKNRELTKIEQFVKSRKKVIKHTPMLWPTEGWLSSPYGYRKDPMGGKGTSFHEGVDIAAWHGSPVRATANGTVEFAGRKSGYGTMVKLSHEYGYNSLYAHLSTVKVKEGESVEKGELIGRVGNSGHSTGSHVHYEIQVNDETINPWPYLIQHYDTYNNTGKDDS